ncbi:uncharacterized protein LOC103710995 [Phoenix dactylifera]|uniref:Uncharacterized protein LOC103710995 n=1 Tax=Phoenix dactylifera TaxID=42345 RepID=A0A8B7CAK0_PHODC|nr:uncharacterized protein LOC103710995 [Phoenix dactylifera]
MACSDPVSSETSKNGKRKRPQTHPLGPQEQEGEGSRDQKKKAKLNGVWANLDLILSLQSKDLPLQRKVELAFDFVRSRGDFSGRGPEPVGVSRLASFLSDWIQPVLISCDNSKKSSELFDPCLNYRSWFILKFCIEKSSVVISPNLLRAITRTSRHALLVINGDGMSDEEESGIFFQQVLECLSLLFESNGRAFYNAGAELWVSCAVEVVNLVRRASANEEHGSSHAEVLLSITSLLLEHFSRFLRFHPNPRNVFRVFVDRLLDLLLDLLVLLHLRLGGSKGRQVGSLLRMVEDVLSNGLFHPIHISGFLSLKSSSTKHDARELKGINESYHRHFFQRLEKIIAEKKAVLLGGFGHLFRLFVIRLKNHKGASLASKGDHSSGTGGEISEEAQETNKPLFEVFVHFMEPLLLECKRCTQLEFLELGEALELRLVETHCMLKSVNETLASFIQEKIYVRTKDTSEGTHYKFLKEVYDTIISISSKIYLFWLSALHKDDARVKKVLPLIASEVFVAVEYFLEIEYRAVGDDLIKLWLMTFSYLAVHLSVVDTKPLSLLVSEILNLGCQVINVFSELRQVSSPIFALCKAVRLFRVAGDAGSAGHSIFVASLPLSSQACQKSLATLLCSQAFRLAISNAIKLIPERQVSGCLQQLNVDLADSLEWMRHSSLGDDVLNPGKANTLNSSILDIDLQAELLGKVLSEVYTIVLDSLTVTATNSILIGKSVENLMKSIRPSFSQLVQNQSNGVNKLLFSLIGTDLSKYECESGLCATPFSMSWVFILFFRMYIACRSLYRQSISLMPPNSSRKASEEMGYLFTVCCGIEWTEKPKHMDEGYFSWVLKPSISLLDVIQTLSEVFLSSSSAGSGPLVYVLHVMAIQRLNDLNRNIKAFQFLQERDERLVHMQLPRSPHGHKSSKKWKRLATASRQEAAGLTAFITGYLPMLASEEKCIYSQSDETGKTETLLFSYEDAWDMGVCSLNENTLPIAIWWLLCQNIDIWCTHATNKDLKEFLSQLIHSSLPSGSYYSDVREQSTCEPLCKKVTARNISLGILNDTLLYDQTVVSKHFPSRFCRIMKKALSPIMRHSWANDIDLSSLPDWSEILKMLDPKPRVNMVDGHALHGHSSNMSYNLCGGEKQSFSSPSVELKTCENLLNLFCKMPGIHVNAKTFSLYASYILNLERLVVSSLLSYCGESVICSPYELFKLFISCRRAMKYLVMASVEGNSEARQSLYLCTLFNCPSSILWLLKSVYEIGGLPKTFFGENYSNQVENMIFSLIDHTCYLFLTISKEQMNSAISSLINNEKLPMNLPVHDVPGGKDSLNEGDEYSVTSDYIETWKSIELMADILMDQTKNLPVTLESGIYAIKPEACFSILSWNKLSSIVSCSQSFLWGLASALDSSYKDCSKGKPQSLTLMPWCVSKLSSYISVFENFVNLCLNILLVDNRKGIDFLKHLPEWNCDNGFLSLDVLVGSAAKCSCCEVEIFAENHLKTHKQSERPESSASGYDHDSKNPSDYEHTKGSRSLEQIPLSAHANHVANAFNGIHAIDLSNLQHLNKPLLHNLLKGESRQIAFTLSHLFNASAAILKLKCMLPFSTYLASQFNCSHLASKPMAILIGTSHIVLRGVAEMVDMPDPFIFIWVDGIVKYLEVVGNYFSLADPTLSNNVFAQIIHSHLRAIGRCISFQGKAATLSSHETGSNTKMLQSQKESSGSDMQFLDHGQCSIDAFKARLRMSFRKFISTPLTLHLKAAVQAIERALVGVQEGHNAVYEINTGNVNGGKVSSVVAAGIDCLDLVLESISGHKRVMKKNIPNLIGALFNIILHLQGPTIFYAGKLVYNKSDVNPDAGSVILMCVEVLTTVARRSSFQMNSCLASQCLHVPMVLFKDFHHLRASHVKCHPFISNNQEETSLTDAHHCVVDRQFSIDLYASCCMLLCTTLKHQKREVERCIGLLEDSVNTLLNCLETVDAKLVSGKGYFTWELQEAIKCGSFLQRIYEEIRHQKDALGRYSYYFLSSYISIYSGYGPHRTGIRREIDEALRPGVYSLVDVCTPADLQQLHTVLGEGPCRSTLATLLHDYRLNFQYEGKI